MAGRLSAPSGRYAGKSAEERKAERRRRFLDAALELFGAGPGYRNTTVAALSEAAGLSTRQFYEEFRTLEDVLAALHLQVNDWAEAAVLAAAASTADAPLAERAAAIFRAYAADVTRDPRRIRIAFVEIIGVSPRLEEQRLARRARWVDLICAEADAAVARGEAAPATTVSPRRASSAASTGCCTTGTRGGSRRASTRSWTSWCASCWRFCVRRRRRSRGSRCSRGSRRDRRRRRGGGRQRMRRGRLRRDRRSRRTCRTDRTRRTDRMCRTDRTCRTDRMCRTDRRCGTDRADADRLTERQPVGVEAPRRGDGVRRPARGPPRRRSSGRSVPAAGGRRRSRRAGDHRPGW